MSRLFLPSCPCNAHRILLSWLSPFLPFPAGFTARLEPPPAAPRPARGPGAALPAGQGPGPLRSGPGDCPVSPRAAVSRFPGPFPPARSPREVPAASPSCPHKLLYALISYLFHFREIKRKKTRVPPDLPFPENNIPSDPIGGPIKLGAPGFPGALRRGLSPLLPAPTGPGWSPAPPGCRSSGS